MATSVLFQRPCLHTLRRTLAKHHIMAIHPIMEKRPLQFCFKQFEKESIVWKGEVLINCWLLWLALSLYPTIQFVDAKQKISASSFTANQYFPQSSCSVHQSYDLFGLSTEPNDWVVCLWFLPNPCQMASWSDGLGNTWQLAAISAPPVNLSSDLLPPPFPLPSPPPTLASELSTPPRNHPTSH